MASNTETKSIVVVPEMFRQAMEQEGIVTLTPSSPTASCIVFM